MKTFGYVDYRDAEFLMFDEEYLATLPAEDDMEAERFQAYVRDEKTGIVYWTKYGYAASYHGPEEQGCHAGWDDEANDFVKAHTLHKYMFHEHWCGCHRWIDLEASNPHAELPKAETEEEGCPRGRFVVEKLWHPSRPDDVLYRELKPRR